MLKEEIVEELKKEMPGMRVKIVELANYEPHYEKGDMGTVTHVDDAGQLHVDWDEKGSIALLPYEDVYDYFMTYENVLKKVKENFKKKRGMWLIHVGDLNSIEDAYDMADEISDKLSNAFNPDDKEKFHFNRMSVGILPKNGVNQVLITFKK